MVWKFMEFNLSITNVFHISVIFVSVGQWVLFYVIVLAGLSCIIAGWGIWGVIRKPKGKDIYTKPDKLQMLPLQILGTNDCQKRYQKYPKMIQKGTICTKALLNRAAFKVYLCPKINNSKSELILKVSIYLNFSFSMSNNPEKTTLSLVTMYILLFNVKYQLFVIENQVIQGIS